MEQKKDSVFKKASKVYLICLGLYLLGWLPVMATDLEYKMWVTIVGSCLLLLGIPVWVFLLWFRWHVREERSRALRCGVTVVSAVLFLLWSYFCFLSLVFGLQEERKLFGGYVVVNRADMLSRTNYDLCKTRALFFRESVEWDSAFEIKYLERKYRQEFMEVPFDQESMLFYDNYGGGVLYGETVPVSPAHQNLPIRVFLSGGQLQDDYVDLLTRWYMAEGCRELAIDRPCEIEEDGNLCLYFTDAEDIGAIALDIQKLIIYARQDEIFEDYVGTIYLSPENAESYERIYIPFGNINGENALKYGYENNIALLQVYIKSRYEEILDNREERLKYDEKWEKRKGEKEQEKMQEEAGKQREPEDGASDDEAEQFSGKTDNMQESVYAEKARLVWEEINASTDIAGEFAVEYNARGEEYYSLGEDGTYAYTLVYDGDSENGACSLYVLYRSPYDRENGTYYNYTDEMTQIMDIYAVVKETGEVISSGRRAWSDPGNSKYRRAVGE